MRVNICIVHVIPCAPHDHASSAGLASFPGPARSSLAVRNSRRGPGLIHHVMCAAAYVTSILLESMMS